MRPRLTTLTRTLAALAGLALAASASAQVQFSYQGRLTDQGAPANGTYDFIFFLYDQAEGDANFLAAPICSPAVQVTDGFFTVELSFDGAFNPGGTYLEVQVGPASLFPCDGPEGSFTTLSPRQPVSPSAYAGDTARLGGQDPAYYLNAANLTGTVPSSQFAGTYGEFVSLTNPANLFMGNGSGINNLNATRITGGTLADARLSTNVALLAGAQTFSGAKTFSATATFSAAAAFSAAPSFTAATPFTVTGTGLVANLNADKLDGLTASQFVRTDAASTITAPVGVSALTLVGSDTFPALDIASNATTCGVRIARDVGSMGSALKIESRAAGDVGLSVNYFNTTSNGYGVEVNQLAPGATGISVRNTAPTGAAVGLFVQTISASSTGGEFHGGVGLHATGHGNDGILAETNSTGRSGLYGVNNISSGVGYGVYGQCVTATGYGLFSNGRTGASGTKSFRIDHPADPTGKYLLHYSAESPEVLNLYRGSVILDNAGEATVLLPDYFAAVNTDPTYQLTPVGAAMPGLFVSREVDEGALAAAAKAAPGQPLPTCSFTIAGGTPGAKVCWAVQAQRFDRFVQTYGAPVEVPKEGRELGTYQLPELYGQPAAAPR